MNAHPRINRMGIELEGQFSKAKYDQYKGGPLYYNYRYLDELGESNYRAYDEHKRQLRRLEYYQSPDGRSYHPYIWDMDSSVEVDIRRMSCAEARALIHVRRYYGPLLPTVDELIQQHDPQNGELKSTPLTPVQLVNFIRYNHPDKQDESCGSHVHLSVTDRYDYERLATPGFYYWFMGQAAHWAQANLTPGTEAHEEFWCRYDGGNTYCCPNYTACTEHSGECQHECELDECREHECQHSCETTMMMRRARRGEMSCLDHECCHDCDEDCCTINHDHDAEGDLCNMDACYHQCTDMDCYSTGECVHECTDDCYSDCRHDCDDEDGECRGPGSGTGIHIPSEQRSDKNHDSRYAHLNFCEARHNTMEVRLGPAFYDADLCASWAWFIADAVQCYLDMEGEAKVERRIQRQDTIQGMLTISNDDYSITSTPYLEIATYAA